MLYREYILGVSAVLGEVTFSGLCTVYMEKMFKDKSSDLTIWDRNFQLAVASAPVYLLIHVWREDVPFFHSWYVDTWFLAFLSAFGGLLVALCLKYTDSILKTFSSTIAIILTAMLSYFLLDGPMNANIAISSCVVVLGVLCYQLQD